MRWVVILLVLMVSVLPVHADERWQYAYITEDGQGRTLWLVDPADLQARAYPLPNADSWLGYATASPDGHYVLLWFNDNPFSRTGSQINETSVLRLLDVQTGVMRDLARLPYYDDSDSPGFTADYNRYPLWSPDSRYIAHLDKVYDLTTGEALAFDVPYLTRAWSPDSSTLAVGDQLCNDNYCFGLSLSTVHVPDMTVTQTLTNRDWYDVCDLNWSPDQTKLVFEVRCSYWISGLFGYGEVMVWDFGENSLQQLTHYTTPQRFYYEQYGWVADGTVQFSTLWLNPHSLLVSVLHWDYLSSPDGYVPNASTFRTGTDLYPLRDGDPTRMSVDWVNVWAKNPRHEQVAYQVERFAISADGLVLRRYARTEIADISGTDLTVRQTLVSGCHLAWSPDGKWLAFTESDTSPLSHWIECPSGTPLHFAITNASLSPRVYSMPEDAMLVGWVRTVPGQAPYFPDGTPTPIPTFVFTGAG